MPFLVWLLLGGGILLCLAAGIALVIGLGGGSDGGATVVVVTPAAPSVTPAPTVIVVTSTLPPVQPPPTSPPPVQPTPTLSGKELFYKENFENPSSGWEADSDTDGWLGYVDGEYAIQVDTPNLVIWGSSATAPDLANFEAEVDARASDGPLDNSFGLVVRYRDNPTKSLYLFRISSDGYYQVVKLDNNMLSPLTDWNPSDAILQGLGVTNHLRVVCDGPNMSFYVNGTHLVDVTDDSFPVGRLGLAVGSYDEGGVLVYFDNLKAFHLDQD